MKQVLPRLPRPVGCARRRLFLLTSVVRGEDDAGGDGGGGGSRIIADDNPPSTSFSSVGVLIAIISLSETSIGNFSILRVIA